MFRDLLKTYKNAGELHHAYLIEGVFDEVFLDLEKFFEMIGFPTNNNPDFWQGNFDTFGIEEGRKINELQQKKSFVAEGKKVFVIKTNFITIEAQNSLLKMFEEPAKQTHFFIITSSSESLLPTLKSRLMIINTKSENDGLSKLTKDFLKANLGERIEKIKELVEDKNKAILFLNALEKELKEKKKTENFTKDDIFVFNEIIQCRSFLFDRSPSVKNILEHIALII